MLGPWDATDLDVEGIKFTIESAITGKPLEIKKSKFLGSWFFNCPYCHQKQTLKVDDIKYASGDKLTGVVWYHKIAQDSLELDKTKDFIAYLTKWFEIVKKHERSKFARMRKGVSMTSPFVCTYCRKPIYLSISAEAVLDAKIPFTLREADIELTSEIGKREVERFAELYGTEDAEKLRELGESAELIPLLKKKPLKWKNSIEYRLEWENDKLSPPENAKKFSERISHLQEDIEKVPLVVNAVIETIETQLVDPFKTPTARHMGMEIVSVLKTNFEPQLKQKLNRQLLENLSWIMKEVDRLA